MVYSDNGRLYHIDVAPGEVGKYVILPETPRDAPLSQSILTMRSSLQTSENT